MKRPAIIALFCAGGELPATTSPLGLRLLGISLRHVCGQPNGAYCIGLIMELSLHSTLMPLPCA